MTARRIAGVFFVLLALSGCGRKHHLIPAVPPPATLMQYVRIVDEQAALNHVPRALILAVIAVESGGNAHATRGTSSFGLMQLKRSTAAAYGVTNLYDPVANITAGTRYLRDLLARFHGNVPLALAGYNAGPGAVAAARGVPPGSREYVDAVMSIYKALPKTAY